MLFHTELGLTPFRRARKLHRLIAEAQITLGGNHKLRIYGTLNCSAGRRMHVQNRVFFQNLTEAELTGYRPCGVCLKPQYLVWKQKEDGK